MISPEAAEAQRDPYAFLLRAKDQGYTKLTFKTETAAANFYRRVRSMATQGRGKALGVWFNRNGLVVEAAGDPAYFPEATLD